MNTNAPKFLIGYKRSGSLDLIVVSYYPFVDFGELPYISVQIGVGRHSTGPMAPAKEMLEFRFGETKYKLIEGELERTGWEWDPPGWFARKCDEANCAWFVPFVERMAAGEDVSFEEIQNAYRVNNEGKEMLQSTWGRDFEI